MKPDAVGTYHDAAGTVHQVVVNQIRRRWQVLDLDLAAERAQVIDTLESPDDGRPQAEAIARDYLETVDGSARRAGPPAAQPIPEQGGRDADSHRRPRAEPCPQSARGAALPDPAR